MEKKFLVVCTVVGFLGLLSAALGFAAEAKRIKSSQVKFTSPSVCVYPRSPALALGLTAALALVIAQIVVNVASGCVCCRKGPHPSNSNWTLVLVCFVVSWFTFVISFLLLLTGAVLNDQRGEENIYFGYYSCYVVKPGVFAGAAVLSLASVVTGIIYYLSLTKSKIRNDPWGGLAAPSQSSIAMAQPQFPSQNTQDPVFVHEDTYIRRQFT
ncbi:protein VASCULATURE COMPLEXITY AND CONNECTIVITY-like [Cornus florida]|uniref:protein VASCULATURE COMPLEXITY AND CONNECTIVITY-like n=1 Tax=Cornus florida TaxID=4283 RepID=UPI00289E458D|nr:protein VASCULATURE COMPLEXITY AND CONNECTIVITY-like [Cornus florida]